ncbi:MAG: patatin-like phospholipase family protein [Nitratireductor sp.]|nr:patatin-like phospholipase family protein [Nitratireductor sp.]
MGMSAMAVRWGTAVVLLALVSACAERPEEAVATRTLLPMEAVDPDASPEQVLTAQSTREDDDGIHTVLALSAGGADGAYGAGVLVGWTKSGTRPKFDVVTGVSTGALMAVLAFLGPDYDNELQRFYTTQSNESIFRKRGLDGLFGESLYDNGPLKEQIEEFVTDDVLRKIATEYAKGRRLYVATTNLDAGELVIWDMGEIANGGRSDDKQHFQKVLRASAAVPAYFAPVYIKPQRGIQLRQAHVDGGVKEPVLVSGFMFPPGKKTKKELYMIINGNTVRENAAAPVKANLPDIAKKSIMEMMREIQTDTIYRDFVLARNVGASFHLTAIPDSIPMAQEGLNFNTARMNKLFQAGYTVGINGVGQWLNEPPHVSRYEKVASR